MAKGKAKRKDDKPDCKNKGKESCKGWANKGCDLCTPCCVAKESEVCRNQYHRNQRRTSRSVPHLGSSHSVSTSSAPTSDTQTGLPATASEPSSEAGPPGTSTSSVTSAMTTSAPAPSPSARPITNSPKQTLNTLWTPDNALAAFMSQQKDVSRRSEQLANEAQVLAAQDKLAKSILFYIWTSPNESATLHQVYLQSHPLFVLADIPCIINMFPPSTTRCDRFSRHHDTWVAMDMNAAVRLDTDEREVCIRACGLSNEQCLRIPGFAFQLPSSTFRTPKRARITTSPDADNANDSSAVRPLKRPRGASVVIAASGNTSESPDYLPSPLSSHPSSPTPAPTSLPSLCATQHSLTRTFPSQYYVREVTQFMEHVDKMRRCSKDLGRLLATNPLGIKCCKASFNTTRALLRRGAGGLLQRFIATGDLPGALYQEYKKSATLLPDDRTLRLPWEESQPGPRLPSPIAPASINADDSFAVAPPFLDLTMFGSLPSMDANSFVLPGPMEPVSAAVDYLIPDAPDGQVMNGEIDVTGPGTYPCVGETYQQMSSLDTIDSMSASSFDPQYLFTGD
ncbi:hypothetical protein DAEQUDRAFT_770926 [Daedalea quercina L-15889]|uniref:Uncharacterized protein n=1 Tax=Daedalea quercina L-15889 TaxID=1314783 RepID=A0A165KGB8_9APHY|nr:hypothetical protein DAEQUDRAFT_770926 [Daedalea quercina L-15889]